MSGIKTCVAKMLENRPIFFVAYKLFHKTFKISFHDFMDQDLSMLFMKPILNIQKFDDWLHDKFGEYENDNLSMSDVLTKNYGVSVAMQVKELLA